MINNLKVTIFFSLITLVVLGLFISCTGNKEKEKKAEPIDNSGEITEKPDVCYDFQGQPISSVAQPELKFDAFVVKGDYSTGILIIGDKPPANAPSGTPDPIHYLQTTDPQKQQLRRLTIIFQNPVRWVEISIGKANESPSAATTSLSAIIVNSKGEKSEASAETKAKNHTKGTTIANMKFHADYDEVVEQGTGQDFGPKAKWKKAGDIKEVEIFTNYCDARVWKICVKKL